MDDYRASVLAFDPGSDRAGFFALSPIVQTSRGNQAIPGTARHRFPAGLRQSCIVRTGLSGKYWLRVIALFSFFNLRLSGRSEDFDETQYRVGGWRLSLNSVTGRNKLKDIMRQFQIAVFVLGTVALLAAAFFIGKDMGDTLWRTGMATVLFDVVCIQLWPCSKRT